MITTGTRAVADPGPAALQLCEGCVTTEPHIHVRSRLADDRQAHKAVYRQMTWARRARLTS